MTTVQFLVFGAACFATGLAVAHGPLRRVIDRFVRITDDNRERAAWARGYREGWWDNEDGRALKLRLVKGGRP